METNWDGGVKIWFQEKRLFLRAGWFQVSTRRFSCSMIRIGGRASECRDMIQSLIGSTWRRKMGCFSQSKVKKERGVLFEAAVVLYWTGFLWVGLVGELLRVAGDEVRV